MRRAPRGSEIRKEKKKRDTETSEAMRRAASDSENREMMRIISKKLRRSRRKVEKLEITLLSLNAGRKSQAKKLGIYARQESRAKKQGNYLQFTMTDNKKEVERAELHRTIWAIADEMRGSVDGWDFKSYILGMLFYRYISENITTYINRGEWETGNKDFNYADLEDSVAEGIRDEMVSVKGFFILPSQLFENVCKVCDTDDNLNTTLESIFKAIESSAKGTASEDDFKGLFADLDVNSNKLGATVIKRNEKLVKLLRGIESMKLGDYQDNTIDAFGDAYEYLMGMYASNAGKSGGEYYTPQEVSELLTKLATVGKTEVNKVYDPACGSGSLLLKAAKILGKDNVRQGFFGQEINLTTYNLCRINMFLHDIDYDKFDIACEDTLLSPQHWDDEPF